MLDIFATYHIHLYIYKINREKFYYFHISDLYYVLNTNHFTKSEFLAYVSKYNFH